MTRILLVEDEPEIRALLKKILAKTGYSILEAGDGIEALETIQRLNGDISLLVSDVRMPKLNGTSLCRQVKETYPSVPVLLMSGNADPEECDVGDAFLEKPLHVGALLNMVAEFCSCT
jgi:CheY-like chemotaxis protein